MQASVIIPTKDRFHQLVRCLTALAAEQVSPDAFEVIVVDDGSSDETCTIASREFPFKLRYFHQTNQGDASARNYGAHQSQAGILIFVDDDIVVQPGYVKKILDEHRQRQKAIICGTCNRYPRDTQTTYEKIISAEEPAHARSIGAFGFTDCMSNNMSLRREDYIAIGMMRSAGQGGSDMWCDVDFAYRALKKGFDFRQVPDAICYHDDYAARDLGIASRRAEMAACRAVSLFNRYPELIAYLPMFRDKPPLAWTQEPVRLSLRKIARRIVSSRVPLLGMEQAARFIEQYYPLPMLLRPLYRWIIGGHIFQGYRRGLKEFGRA